MTKKLMALLVALMMLTGPALAEDMSFFDTDWAYATAVRLFHAGEWEQAVSVLERVDTYEQAQLYLLYAYGMMALEDARYDDAQIYFDLLEGHDFLDSADMVRYVNARRLEAQGDEEGALAIYRLLVVQDSLMRAATLMRSIKDDLAQVKVLSFAADTKVQANLSKPVVFTAVTSMEADRLELVSDAGEVLYTSTPGDYVDFENRVWTLTVHFAEPFTGLVRVRAGNAMGYSDELGGAWLNIQVGQAGQAPEPQEVTGHAVGVNGPIEKFTREDYICFGLAADYAGEDGMRGVLTFRGSNMRQNAAYGMAEPETKTLKGIWTAEAGLSTWATAPGAQPLIVQWHANIREMMGLKTAKKDTSVLKEVIFAGNNGVLYFYDLADGAATRDEIVIDPVMPMLGTPSVYPKGYPVLAVGSGDPEDLLTQGETGLLLYNMIAGTQIGTLPSAVLGTGVSDAEYVTASALIENETDMFVSLAGNGTLTTMKLNIQLDPVESKLTVKPEVEFFYLEDGYGDASAGTSLAVYGAYAYYVTNAGLLVCVDLNTMEGIWGLELGARVEMTAALRDMEHGTRLYVGTVADAKGMAYMRCVDAATGKVLWQNEIPGSIQAAPLVGEGILGDMVYYTVQGSSQDFGLLYAVDAETGEVVWSAALAGKTHASPLAVYGTEDAAWIVQGDGTDLLLIDAVTGEKLDTLSLGSQVYGSPAAFDDMVVIATQDGTLHGIQIQ